MDKTNNFLESIKKLSEENRAETLREAEEHKAQELKKAKEKGSEDAHRYVSKLLSEKQSQITSEYAVKNLEAHGEILKKRDEMIKKIFDEAKGKLVDFTKSENYKNKLINDAEEISQLFSDKSCVIYVKDEDIRYAEDIKKAFNSKTEIKADVKILIGGIRGFCEEKNIVADNTLDSKLETQKKWFVENAELKVK